jgi:hypothetical protein
MKSMFEDLDILSLLELRSSLFLSSEALQGGLRGDTVQSIFISKNIMNYFPTLTTVRIRSSDPEKAWIRIQIQLTLIHNTAANPTTPEGKTKKKCDQYREHLFYPQPRYLLPVTASRDFQILTTCHRACQILTICRRACQIFTICRRACQIHTTCRCACQILTTCQCACQILTTCRRASQILFTCRRACQVLSVAVPA